MQDIAQALGNSLSRDGNGSMRAPLDHGGFKAINLGAGTSPTDAVRMDQIAGVGIPVGMPALWLMDTPPTGWLLCYGQAVSRANYAELFAVLGTRFGAGDAATTFNLPDFRGLVPAGLDNMGGTASGRLPDATALGSIIGAATVALTTAQMPSHAHTGTTGSGGDHTHLEGAHVEFGTGSSVAASPRGTGSGSPGRRFYTSSGGAHAHSFTTDSRGDGAAHQNVQPTFPLNIIIKARNV